MSHVRREAGGAAIEVKVDTGGLQPWHLFLVAGLGASMAAVTLSTDTRPETLVMLSLVAFSAVFVGVAFHRMLIPLAGVEADTDAPVLSARARAALQREKMLVLRSIKELEFDRAMGKIADVDFDEMVGRLRARAIALMTRLDAEAAGYRGLVERDLEAQLATLGVTGVAPVAPAATGGEPREGTPAGQAPAPTVLACGGCGALNDHDARFCKKCGARLDAYAVSM